MRRALNYAVDRATFVRLYGGPIANAPTGQIIPPGLPGHSDYCPYTLAPTPGGTWTAPDLSRARALVAASGMRGTRVTLWSVSDSGSPEPGARYLVSLLRRLGFRAGVRVLTSAQNAHASRSSAQLGLVDFGPDHPSAAEIFALFLACDGALSSQQFCDPAVDRATRLAESLRLSDPVRSASLWARLDREPVDRAVWVPLVTQRIVDIVSPRLGNYEFSPVYHFMPAQAWLR